MIIFLVPITQLLLRNADPFDAILYGSFVAAASPLWLTLDDSVAMSILFVVTLSLGEAIYSPKVTLMVVLCVLFVYLYLIFF
jgi:hypothetical protein